MIFKELDTKERFSNKYGKNAYIKNYCYYEGTEQISIYISTGFGFDEKTINEVISEHNLSKWIEEFTNSNTENMKEKITKEDEQYIDWVNDEIESNAEEIPNLEVKEDFDSMRKVLFDSMRKLIDGSLEVEKAKTVSSLAQTIINSVKVEVDFVKITGSKDKPKMIK